MPNNEAADRSCWASVSELSVSPPPKKGGGIVGINQMGEYTSMGPRGSDLSLPDSVEAMRQLSINRKWILGLLLFGSLALLLLKLLGL